MASQVKAMHLPILLLDAVTSIRVLATWNIRSSNRLVEKITMPSIVPTEKVPKDSSENKNVTHWFNLLVRHARLLGAEPAGVRLSPRRERDGQAQA
jgi:hypothetical protein